MLWMWYKNGHILRSRWKSTRSRRPQQLWLVLIVCSIIQQVNDLNTNKRYLALDTNVLISGLSVLQEFSEFVESQHFDVEFLIAGIVVEELDGLKKRGAGSTDQFSGQNVAQAARAASNWLLSGLRRRSHTGRGRIRGQAYQETRQSTGSWKSRASGVRIVPVSTIAI